MVTMWDDDDGGGGRITTIEDKQCEMKPTKLWLPEFRLSTAKLLIIYQFYRVYFITYFGAEWDVRVVSFGSVGLSDEMKSPVLVVGIFLFHRTTSPGLRENRNMVRTAVVVKRV